MALMRAQATLHSGLDGSAAPLSTQTGATAASGLLGQCMQWSLHIDSDTLVSLFCCRCSRWCLGVLMQLCTL